MGGQHRHRRGHKAQYVEWHDPKNHLQDWRSTSPTVRSLRESAFRFRISLEAVRKGLHTARYSAFSSGKETKLRILHYLRVLHSLKGRQSGLTAEKAALDRSDEVASDLHQVLKELTSKRDSQSFAAGLMLFGCLLFVAGSQPWLLPWAYVAFILVCLPLRCADFIRRKWTFFLLDFCYWANVATTAYLLIKPANSGLFMALYALADGPLAAALIVWQTAWVFGSSAHTISVLIHQLPGLALFAFRHYSPPSQLDSWLARPPTLGPRHFEFSFVWSFFVPVGFYLGWQISYFLIVQVLCRHFIQINGYDTSYNCLARRAVKSNNFWNRTVRKGSTMRRVFMFGLIQAIYTVCVLLLLIPISMSFHLSFAWQAVKLAFPVWHGSRYICEKVPRHAVMKVWKQQQMQY